MIVFPNCKINLGLYITRKRPDGFHDLETVFYPLPVTDALEIVQHQDAVRDFEITLSGLTIDSSWEDNICSKAYHLLKADFPSLPAVKMHLHKSIPSGAGLGGGSADGAFTLRLLNEKFRLGLPTDQLIQYALRLGSDCPFFIKNRPSIAGGRGELLEEIDLDLSSYKTVLVNPGIHVNTGWAFSQLVLSAKTNSLRDIIQRPVVEWKVGLGNDFEQPVFEKYPVIREIKEKLYNAGALYASMSGSGSTVYGLFDKNAVAEFNFPPGYFIWQV